MSLAPPNPSTRRSRIALAAVLALGCAAGGAFAQAASRTLPAQHIVIDSVTGRPRMPDHEEFAAMRQAAAAAASAQRSAAGATRGAAPTPTFSSHPVLQRMQGQALATRFGATGRRVGADKLSFSVVRRNADGTFEEQCVSGEDAATHALHAGAKEASHAQ